MTDLQVLAYVLLIATAALSVMDDGKATISGMQSSPGQVGHYSWSCINLLAIARHTPEMIYVLQVITW